MGMNFYLVENVCAHCGRGDDRLHIGKSSAGWCFSLHVIPEEGINSLSDWVARWSREGSRILDECGDAILPHEMHARITRRSWVERGVRPQSWYDENSAVAGSHGLARHRVDGHHCVGHGDGTWDLIAGEFS